MSPFFAIKDELEAVFRDETIEAIGVIDTEQYQKNVESFQKILENHRLKSAVHAVLKVNNSKHLLRESLKFGLRADVSSMGELDRAVEVGFSPEKITANGPKKRIFLEKLCEIGATISVDSLEELEFLGKWSEENHQKISILIRLGTFQNAVDTRFGIAKFLWAQAVEILKNHRNFLECLGFHFHIDIPDVHTRMLIFWESIEFYQKLLSAGIRPKIIDIGGGFGTLYKNDIIPGRTRFTHSHHKMYTSGEYTAGEFLQFFLSTKTKKHPTNIATFLRENGIELWIEPGRSMLSRDAGFVATTVLGTREDSAILNTNSFWVGMREEELPTDPILLGDEKTNDKNGNFSYFLLWNLCLESDIIYSRAIHFGRKLQNDDIIIFPNMAAYHMDFYETQSISHPKKRRFYLKNGQLFPDQ